MGMRLRQRDRGESTSRSYQPDIAHILFWIPGLFFGGAFGQLTFHIYIFREFPLTRESVLIGVLHADAPFIMTVMTGVVFFVFFAVAFPEDEELDLLFHFAIGLGF
jgi:hypothetical protein